MGVAGGGEDAVQEVGEREDDAGGVDAGVTGIFRAVAEVLVDYQSHLALLVVDEAHRRDGAGVDVEVIHHVLLIGKRQTRAA